MANSNTNYNVKSSNGEKIYVVNEKETNTDTPIVLIGKGLPEYGEPQNTNFLHILENFNSASEPSNPVEGMLWYKKDEETTAYELKVCKNPEIIGEGRWDKIPQVHTESGETAPTNPTNGDIWYNNSTHKLFIYDGNLGEWVLIGPTSKDHILNDVKTALLERDIESEKSITLPASIFGTDTNTSTISSITSIGSLNYVTVKVLAKEFIKGLYNNNVRSCCWLYKFVVQVKRISSDEYTYEIVGSPDYELIGKTGNTNWIINITKDANNNDIYITLKDQGEAVTNSCISFGCSYEIIRI